MLRAARGRLMNGVDHLAVVDFAALAPRLKWVDSTGHGDVVIVKQ